MSGTRPGNFAGRRCHRNLFKAISSAFGAGTNACPRGRISIRRFVNPSALRCRRANVISGTEPTAVVIYWVGGHLEHRLRNTSHGMSPAKTVCQHAGRRPHPGCSNVKARNAGSACEIPATAAGFFWREPMAHGWATSFRQLIGWMPRARTAWPSECRHRPFRRGQQSRSAGRPPPRAM